MEQDVQPVAPTLSTAGMKFDLKVPIVFGRNRLKGSAEGAMVDDDLDESSTALRSFLVAQAKIGGVEPTLAWLTSSMATLLRMYEQGHAEWTQAKNDTIGFAYEMGFPSGATIVLASRQVLQRLPS